MNINTDHLNHCISTPRVAWEGLQQCETGDVLYEIYRAACVKEFELVLGQSGRLLKRRLLLKARHRCMLEEILWEQAPGVGGRRLIQGIGCRVVCRA